MRMTIHMLHLISFLDASTKNGIVYIFLIVIIWGGSFGYLVDAVYKTEMF